MTIVFLRLSVLDVADPFCLAGVSYTKLFTHQQEFLKASHLHVHHAPDPPDSHCGSCHPEHDHPQQHHRQEGRPKGKIICISTILIHKQPIPNIKQAEY